MQTRAPKALTEQQRSNDRFFCVYSQAPLLANRARNAPSRRATSGHRSLSGGTICMRHRRKRPRLSFEFEQFPSVIWEPASGPGAIVRVLRRHARMVYATDLNDCASRDQHQSGRDFLLERQLPLDVQAIVTNVPFKLAEQFVAHALELCPLVMMLLLIAFLESERRTPILDNGKLARVHIFKKRLPMMHRAGWDGPKASSGVGCAWFIWGTAHKGPAEVDRISWDRTGGRP